MKYADYQNTLSLQMIYTGYSKVGTEWCYGNVISPFTRIYLIDEGHASVYMNRKKYELREGDLFIIPKFTFHKYECEKCMGHYYICFLDQLIGGRNLFEYADINYRPRASELDKCLMKRFLELNPDCDISDPDPKSYDNRPELLTINREKPTGGFRKDIESNGILLQLFSKFLGEGTVSLPIPSGSHQRMTQVFNYINNHLSQKLNVSRLSEIMCVSTDHFIRIFKSVNGLTPNQYIQRKRVERAQTLMLSSDMSIKEIAEEVGIPNLSQFSKLFYKQAGVAPSLYMQQRMAKPVAENRSDAQSVEAG